MDISVIAGGASEDLAERIAERLNADLVRTKTKVFPDGESRITLDGAISGGVVVVVQSAYPPVDTNLMTTLSLISSAGEKSDNVVAVIPYMGYARQDREFLQGEVVTMKVLGRLFDGVGTSRIITVDIHSTAGLKHLNKADNVSAIPSLVQYFGGLRLKDPMVVSPDQGGKGRAEEFARMMEVPWIALEKSRDRKTGRVRINTGTVEEVRNRDLILVDDMISTGGSIIKAAQFLKRNKCRKMFVACTHALLINDAHKKIRQAGVARIVSTNTIPRRTSVVDISDVIAETIAIGIKARK